VDQFDALARIAGESIGHLGTVRPDGRPHVVVATFAVVDGNIVTAIDHKPKRTERLQRLVNIEANPSVTFLVDHYQDDWAGLWWVRVDGIASTHQSGGTWDDAIEALTDKYEQYRLQPPKGVVISIGPEQIRSWSSTP
jgi:PPOX class probable F420-dependent enzyme